ncbi:hypothetical protein DPMN_017169 [Dreissena polymorpha]|uniref:Uncharacterized protein n=1 Tax=Dreissena polymorpha TaxID=45954 RepID=A0A9D4NCN8_DREPO|nr:hypothetical protein DPMN_017169 [Dreissena polymorpha]
MKLFIGCILKITGSLTYEKLTNKFFTDCMSTINSTVTISTADRAAVRQKKCVSLKGD